MRDLALAAGIVAVVGGGTLAFQHLDFNNSKDDKSSEIVIPHTVTTQQTGMVIEKKGKRIIMGKNGITIIEKNGDTTQIGSGGITRNGKSVTGNTNNNSITTVVRSKGGIKVTTTVNGETTVKEYKTE